jgi:hypothetical protein
MPDIPDLTDPRYLEEIGWFLYRLTPSLRAAAARAVDGGEQP